MSRPGSWTIAQVNANSLSNKKAEIENYLSKNDVTFFCINDTRLVKNKKIKIKGYKLIRKDNPIRRGRAGGVAIFIKNGITAFEVNTSGIEELLVIDAKMGHLNIRIGTIYLHPGKLMLQRHFDVINNQSGQNIDATFFIGDVNAHVGLGKHGKTDRAGVTLQRLVDSNGFSIINNDEPTYYSFSKSTTSCIDICMIKTRKNGVKTRWSTAGSCGSDHVITCVDVTGGHHVEEKTICKTDWNAVRLELETEKFALGTHSINDIDQSIINFNEKINSVVDKNTKRIKVLTRNGHYLSKDTTNDICLRRKLMQIRKSWEEKDRPTDLIRTVINRLNKEIKQKIKKDVEIHESRQIKEIWDERDSGKAWTKLKSFDPDLGKNKSNDEIQNGIEDANGVLQREDEAVAKIHGSRLENAHSFPSDPNFDNAFCQKIEEDLRQMDDELKPNLNRAAELINKNDNHFIDEERVGQRGKKIPAKVHDDKITTNEIKENLKHKKNRSSVGRDGVSYKALKHAGQNARIFMARLFSILLLTGYFPKIWREATVRMIPKAGKDLTKSKN